MRAIPPSTKLPNAETAPAACGSSCETRYVDEGWPLPETYDTDVVWALVQDPFRILVYWDVRDESVRALSSYFSSDDIAKFKVALKKTEEGAEDSFVETTNRGRQWMAVTPEREYQFEIGVRSPVHGYITIARSGRIYPPRATGQASSGA